MIRRLAFLLLLAISPAPVFAEEPLRGVALVIGQSKYDELPALANPAKDARDIDEMLGDLGFEVDRVLNADGDELREAIERFVEDAADADVAFVYYSGHGIEVKGENFLAPTDTSLATPESAGSSMIAVQPLLEALSKVVPVSIVLLDACRSDPFPPGQLVVLPGDSEPVAIESQGLAAVRGPTPLALPKASPDSLGTVIGFAAEPGAPALDGAPGENSPYAAALLKHFAAGGFAFGDVMTMVTEEVYLKTKAKQLPWTNSSLRRILTFSAPEDLGDADATAIKTERRKLLLSISGTPTETRRYVEALAGQEQVPLDALYGMLEVLGVEASDGGDLQDQLQKGADQLKELMARAPQPVKADAELERLSTLAGNAEAEGAIALALRYREAASARADTLLEGKRDEARRLQQDMVDIANTYAANAATALLNFDHLSAAALYGKAYDAVKDWDRDLALEFKLGQGGALADDGYYKADSASVNAALSAYADALQLTPRQTFPLEWGRVQDRIGQAQQTIGAWLADDAMLGASIESYNAALTVRTRASAPEDWAKTQNNLAVALQTLGSRRGDVAMIMAAVDAYDASLGIFTSTVDPIRWASLQSNRGAALIDVASMVYAASNDAELAAYLGGNEQPETVPEVAKAISDANALLEEAILGLEAATAQRSASEDPFGWAMLRHTVGSGYQQRGMMNHSVSDMQRAVEAYRAVLEIDTRERAPAQWVRTANNLAITLRHISDETSDPEPMRQAVELYRSLLTVVSKQEQPLDWADYEQNLGLALGGLAGYEDAVTNLDASIAAYKAAADITTFERDPQAWKDLRTGLSTVLIMRGLHAMDRTSVDEGIQLAQEARDKLAAIGLADDAFYSSFLAMADQVLEVIPK